jgi:hypothetical protein
MFENGKPSPSSRLVFKGFHFPATPPPQFNKSIQVSLGLTILRVLPEPHSSYGTQNPKIPLRVKYHFNGKMGICNPWGDLSGGYRLQACPGKPSRSDLGVSCEHVRGLALAPNSSSAITAAIIEGKPPDLASEAPTYSPQRSSGSARGDHPGCLRADGAQGEDLARARGLIEGWRSSKRQGSGSARRIIRGKRPSLRLRLAKEGLKFVTHENNESNNLSGGVGGFLEVFLFCTLYIFSAVQLYALTIQLSPLLIKFFLLLYYYYFSFYIIK